MSEFFDGIMQGLSEAIEYELGNLPNVRVHKILRDADEIDTEIANGTAKVYDSPEELFASWGHDDE